MRQAIRSAFLLSVLCSVQRGYAEDVAPPRKLRLVAEFRNGMRLVGTSLVEALPAETLLGPIEAPLRAVTRIEFPEEGEQVTIHFRNGDRLRGQLKTDALKMRTLLGELSAPVDQLSRLIVGRGPLPSSLARDLLLEYSYTEQASETVKDSSGNGLHGTIKGAQWECDESVGGTLKLDGTDDWIDCGNDARLHLTKEVTLEVMVLAGGHMIAKSNIHYSSGNYNLWVTEDLRLSFGYWDQVGHSKAYYSSDALSQGQWHHLVATYRFRSHDLQLYVDGRPVAGAWDSQPTGPTPQTSRNKLGIGAAVVAMSAHGDRAGDTRSHFRGSIALVRVFKRALSPSEVRLLRALS